jgi:hypothetical protein
VGRKYFIGGDSSGGTGRDDAVFVVMRDDFEVCAIWRSNTSSPTQQAIEASKLAAMYNGAVVLCEENNYGRVVNDEIERLGARTWRGEDGKRFWSQGGRAGESKMRVYTHARRMFDEQLCCSVDGEPRIHDEDLLKQISYVREDKNGNVQAPDGLHDDIVDAWCFALWCGKHYKPPPPPKGGTLGRLGW